MAFTRGLPKKPKRPMQGKGRGAGQADERKARKTKRTLAKLTKRLKGIQRPTSGGKPMVDPKRKVADFVPKPFKPKKPPTRGVVGGVVRKPGDMPLNVAKGANKPPKGKRMAKGGAMKAKGMKAGGMMKAKGMKAGGKMKAKGYAKGGMMKAKGMTKGGAMKAKGAQKGGMKRNMRAPVKKNSGLYGR